jgi:hypothetical protein
MTGRWKASFSTAVLVVLGLAIAAPGQAQVVFTLGNNPQPGEENVLLNTGATGNTIFGLTNQTSVPVQFTSLETLAAPSNGQARVEGVDGVVGPEALTISLTSGNTFGDIIFNPFIGGANAPGDNDLTVTANTTAGAAAFTYTLGNGSNFLTIVADAGVRITSVVLDPVVGFTDLRQIRISDVQGPNGGPPEGQVPEPGTLAMLGGLVCTVGLLFRRARR